MLLVCQFVLVAAGCENEYGSPTKVAEPRVKVAATGEGIVRLQPVTAQARAYKSRLENASDAEVATDRFNSAWVCGACHEEIFEKWSRSMHSLAYSDPVFKDALLRAFYYSGGEAARLCLGCHSPTVTETNDLFGREDLTHEGVTCDYCHSISSIVEDPNGQMRDIIDHTRRHGPFNSPAPAAHQVERRDYFERSEICASCHDYTTPEGTVVFATYAEWRASKYAEEGTQCQDCHMPRVVTSNGARGEERVFNDHDLQGGHSPSQIKRAVAVRVEEVVRDADRVRVVVAVENVGAGHSVPTGLPSRMLVLEVSAKQRGSRAFHHEIVYQRVMQGGDGSALTEDWEIKLGSKGVLRDNRIRSGEIRRETVVFDASPAEDVVLGVRISYRYRPKIGTTRTMEVPITDFEKIIARGL